MDTNRYLRDEIPGCTLSAGFAICTIGLNLPIYAQKLKCH